MSPRPNNGRRRSDKWWMRALIGALLTLFVAESLSTWKMVAVMSNDLTHLDSRLASVEKLMTRLIWQFADDE